jgi:predicted nucleotide-binding protein (sugar kinase/HSP70/actin superfamily)
MINKKYKGYDVIFEKKDRNKTILIPWFTDFLSPLIPAVAKIAGYNFVKCPKTTKKSAEIGLKYGHNEVCYPATLVLGDLIAEIKTDKYPLDNLAVAITQTGGQCRATNYISLIKNGLKNAGFGQIPVIAVSLGGTHNNEQSGFKLPVFRIFSIALNAFLFGDALNQIFSAAVVREKNSGESKKLFDFYMDEAKEIILQKKHKKMLLLLEKAVEDFNKISIFENKMNEKIGLVGEIFVKYNDFGQAHITDWLHQYGCEVMVPPMIDFFMQTFVNKKVNCENGITKINWFTKKIMPLFQKILEKRIEKVENIAKKCRFHTSHNSIFEKAKYAEEILHLSNQFGEGWLIAGEIASFARRGINKVVCVQPFGCIANHVVAKGIEKRLKQFYPTMNLLFLDIDSGIAEVNLQNRLHFFIGN